MPHTAKQAELPAAVHCAWPPRLWRETHVVVATSGGADSVALLLALLDLKRAAGGAGRLFVAHFNHGMRGAESDGDEHFVMRLGEALGAPVKVGRPAPGEEIHGEQAARDARYAFLQQVAEAVGARYVATAHTADDQLETILLRVLRGSGLAGLGGVPGARPLGPAVTVVRPLLGVRRAQVEAHLAGLGQTYRTDSSNTDTRYARNRVRGVLLPMLREQFGPSVDDALLRLGRQAAEAHEVVAGLACAAARSAIARGDPAVGELKSLTVSPAGLAGSPPLVAREALRLAWREAGWPEQSMGAEEWVRLHALLAAGPGAAPLQLPGGVDARWVADRLVLRREAVRPESAVAIDRARPGGLLSDAQK